MEEEMAESRRLVVKLFGKTISVLAETGVTAAPLMEAGSEGAVVGLVVEGCKESSSSEDRNEQLPKFPTGAENDTPSSDDQEAAPPAKNPKRKEERNGTASPPEAEKKTVKKPDKVLPCPRCNSMDTKFCYYNNYNLGQPRHFCRGCQRYWTAGGAMRNLPVGAGRRKSKHSAYHHRLITISQASLHDVPHHTVPKPNETVLSFGSGMPTFYDTMASALNLVEQQRMSRCSGAVENGEGPSSESSATASNSPEKGGGNPFQVPASQNSGEHPPQAPPFDSIPWPYLWSSAPALCSTSYPIPFYPTIAWSVPWLAPPSSSHPNSGGFALNSPTLGKHPRDENTVTEINGESHLWIPKTLRIDDPEEAAKSSIWTAIGMKGHKAGGISKGGLFRGFDEAKPETSSHPVEISQVLQANPAALSRSLYFQDIL